MDRSHAVTMSADWEDDKEGHDLTAGCSSKPVCLDGTTWASTQEGVLRCMEFHEMSDLVAAGGDQHGSCHQRGRPLQGGAVPQRSSDLQA